MDFKSLVSKINELNDPVHTVQAPTLPQSIQLDERAQMRVLAGQTTILAESKKKAEEDVKEEMKTGDSKKTVKGGTVTKTKTGIVHKAGPGTYGGSDDKDTDPDADDDAPKGKKGRPRSNESIEEASDAKKAAQEKFKAMIAKKKGDKKESVKESADKKKCPPMSHIKKMCQDGKSVTEICKMHPDCDQKELKQMVADCKEKLSEGAKPDFLDIDKDGDKKEPMKKAAADKGSEKNTDKKGLSDKQKKLPPGLQKAIAKKRPVKESYEGKLTFKEMIKLVQESGGQQQIDPVDTALFTWAQRVAAAKFNEGTKAEIYAGLIYERNGGVFEMYDVLAETK
jgi:hypothetical protein